jgi:transcriptional regulator with XRE-family HTH domain
LLIQLFRSLMMEDDSLHIGTILRSKRAELGLSISDISRLTGIRTAIIEAIETGSLDVMPRVYMQSFIRRYARALGIDERSLPPLEPQHPPAVRTSTQSSTVTTKPRVAVVVAIAIAVIGSAAYFIQLGSHDSSQHPTSISHDDQPAETIRTQPRGGLLEYLGGSTSDSMRLEVIATDTVWLSVTLDGRRSEQVTLRPGDERRWFAHQTVILSIGNAGGVEIYRNGERLPPLGQRGEAVRYVKITPTELIPSTSSWSRKRDSVLQTIRSSKAPSEQQSSVAPHTQRSQHQSSQVVSRKQQTNSTQQQRRQQMLIRARAQQEITPVTPKAPLPASGKPNAP